MSDTPRNPQELQALFDDCYDQLSALDDMQPLSDEINLLWRYGRIALSAVASAREIAGVPKRDRPLYHQCLAISLQKLLDEANKNT